ncbi:hypothetical protein INR49_007982 [Caranx melampygus]|nr:hypothetical protein INR49_007982 [Caranx melampygus]
MLVSPEVTVSRGQDVVLSCSFTHPRQQKYSGLIRVKWLSQAGGQKSPPFFTCSLRNDSTGDHSSCSGSALRHSLTGDPRRGELSLLLRKVQLTDNGLYFCRVELDDRGDSFQKYTELHVRAEPQILSLSVVDSPSGSDGAPRRLQCSVEGHPLPKIVWLRPSRKMMENQGGSYPSGPYQVTSSVPYLEEGEELTCRAENEVGGAERTYPPRNSVVITLVVCGLVTVLLVSAGLIIAYRRYRVMDRGGGAGAGGAGGAGGGGGGAEGDAEAQLVYSDITVTRTTSSPPADLSSSLRQQEEDPGVLYSAIRVGHD